MQQQLVLWCDLHHLNTDFEGVILHSEFLTVLPPRDESPLVLFLPSAVHQEELPEVRPSGHLDLEAKAPRVREFLFLGCISHLPFHRDRTAA